MRPAKMSSLFDTASTVVYLMFMFTDRVRRAFAAMTRRVDVWPDTLVLRAMQGTEHGRAHASAGRG
jgi:hypothetical protein